MYKMRTKLKFQEVFYENGILTEDNSNSLSMRRRESAKPVVFLKDIRVFNKQFQWGPASREGQIAVPNVIKQKTKRLQPDHFLQEMSHDPDKG